MQQYLSLNADEVMVLIDRVQNYDHGTEDMFCAAYPLLLRLGSAYVEVFGGEAKKDGEVPVAVSESEAWLLRSKVASSDKTPSNPMFGVRLLCKIYRILLRYNDGLGLEESGGVDDEFTSDRKAALKRWVGGA